MTEYGVADVSGKSDAEVIAAMLSVADSRFQPELARHARDAGKLPKGFEIPAAHRENFPERIAGALKPAREAGLLPSFPFGSDFTDVEQRLIPALQLLQAAQRTPLQLPGLLWQGLLRRPMPQTKNALRGSASTARDIGGALLPCPGQRGTGEEQIISRPANTGPIRRGRCCFARWWTAFSNHCAGGYGSCGAGRR